MDAALILLTSCVLLAVAAAGGLPKMALVALALFLGAAGGGAVLNLKYHWK